MAHANPQLKVADLGNMARVALARDFAKIHNADVVKNHNADLVSLHAKARDRALAANVEIVSGVEVVRTDVRIARLRAKTRVKMVRVLKLLVQRFLIFIMRQRMYYWTLRQRGKAG